MTNDRRLGGVTIGNVTGGIHGSVIAGQNVRDVIITIGGHPTPANKQPNADELKQLLTEIQSELQQLIAQRELLSRLSPSAEHAAQGAHLNVKDATDKISSTVKADEAKTIQKRLTEATSLVTTIFDGVKSIAEKAGDAASAIQPVAEKVGPLLEKLAVAGLWVSKLWLPS